MKKLISISPRALFVCPGLALLLSACATPTPTVHEDPIAPARDSEEPGHAATGQVDAQALALFSHGMTLEAAGDWPGAASNYLKAVQLDPDDASLSMLAARRLLAQDEDATAFEVMEALMERQPDNAQAFLWLASLHLAVDQHDQALVAYQKAITANPTIEEAYLAAARILQGLQQEDEALHLLDQAIEHAENPFSAIQLKTALLLKKANSTLDDAEARDIREEAITLLRKSLTRFPEAENLPYHAAGLLARDQRVVEMLEVYRHAESQHPGNLRQRQKITLHLIRSIGDAGTAEMKLRAYLLRSPNDGWVHYLLGQLLEMDNRANEALASYERALRLNEEDSPSLWKFCQLLIQAERTQEAQTLLEKRIAKHPTDLESKFLAATIHQGTGHPDLALKLFGEIDQSLQTGETHSNEALFRHSYAITLFIAGHADKASEQLARAVELTPQFLEIFWRAGLNEADHVLPDETAQKDIQQRLLKTLKATAARLPNNPAVIQSIGRHHHYLLDYEAALKSFQHAMHIAEQLSKPETFLTADFFFDLGSVYERLKNLEEAERYLQRSLNLKPDFANAYNTLAYMWAENDIKLDRALEYVTLALQHAPGSGAIMDTRGWVYFMQGKYEEAYQDLLKAAELLAIDPTIMEHLGDVLVKLDKPVQALGYYRIAEELDSKTDMTEKIQHAQSLVKESIESKTGTSEESLSP